MNDNGILAIEVSTLLLAAIGGISAIYKWRTWAAFWHWCASKCMAAGTYCFRWCTGKAVAEEAKKAYWRNLGKPNTEQV
jgi:hypothetical protein